MGAEELINETISNGSSELLGLVGFIGQVGLWLSAVGAIVVIWMIVQIVNLIVNRKKRKALYRIEDKLNVLEKKIDKLTKLNK